MEGTKERDLVVRQNIEDFRPALERKLLTAKAQFATKSRDRLSF